MGFRTRSIGLVIMAGAALAVAASEPPVPMPKPKRERFPVVDVPVPKPKPGRSLNRAPDETATIDAAPQGATEHVSAATAPSPSLVVNASASSSETPGVTSTRVLATDARRFAGRLEAEFHAVMTEYNVPGAAFVLVKDGEIIRSGSRGVRRVGASGRVNTDTVFPLASVSKTFAGTLTALLVEEERFSLHDPIKRFVPDLSLRARGHVERIEVAHLLSHSTGLVPNAYDNLLDAGQSLDVILPKFKKVKPICRPGECYGYQNIFFSLIEPVIEQTAESDYPTLVQERLLAPLGMTHASVGFEALKAETNRASPHVFRKRGGWTARKIRPNYYAVLPAAGVNASVNDLAQWLIAHMGDKPDVLSPEHLALIRTPLTRTSREKRRRFWKDHLTDADYGLGWRLYEFEGHDLVYHGGGIQGFRSSVAYSTELGIGMAVLMNAESRAIDDLNTRVWDTLFKEAQLAEARVGVQGR